MNKLMWYICIMECYSTLKSKEGLTQPALWVDCEVVCCCSVIQSCPTLRPHGLQHAMFPCLSSPGACSNSCRLSQWHHPTISSSVVPFSSCLQSFPASGSFLMGWLFASGGQSIGASVSVSVLLMNISGLISFGIDWLDLLVVQRTLKNLLQHHCSKASILWCSAFFMVQVSHPYMTTGKTKALTIRFQCSRWRRWVHILLVHHL